MIKLTEAEVDQWYVLDHITELDHTVRNRMLTLGFVQGRPVKVKFTSGLFGPPKFVIQIDTVRYALTHSEAEHVYVRKI